jgi:type IV pilus assembly protein PilM
MGLFDFKPKGKLGVDIGTASIKLVELSKDAGRFKLENYGLFELESVDEAINVSGQAAKSRVVHLSDQDLAWGIKEVLNRTKIKSRDAIASIPSFSTFSTIITMPYLSEKDIAKTIPFEARKYIPIPLNEVVLDWSIINVSTPNDPASPTKTPTVEVFLVAVPIDETERYKRIMTLAGLNLRALELENSALVRALLGNDLSPVAIVNIGGRSTSILIVDNGFERVSHNYEVGGFEITRSISKSLNVGLKRAEELKKSFGMKDVDNNVILQAMSSLIDMMALETKKTIKNYEDMKQTKVTKVILVGGLVNMPNFSNYFGAKLSTPVVLGNPLARVVLPEGMDRLKGELSFTFAISIGLAMREI